MRPGGALALSGRPAFRRQLETLEFESRRDRAAHERPVPEAFCGLPMARRHNGLRPFTLRQIGPEHDALDRPRVARRDIERERRAGVVVPDLDRINPMPVRALAAREQEIDRGRGGAAVDRQRIAKGLAKMAPLRMRLEIEERDDIGRGEGHQNLFLRSRISAKTCHAGLPDRPTSLATSGRSARRNGFAAFSSPMNEGIVICLPATSVATSRSRSASAALSGSMVLAKRILAIVYS